MQKCLFYFISKSTANLDFMPETLGFRLNCSCIFTNSNWLIKVSHILHSPQTPFIWPNFPDNTLSLLSADGHPITPEPSKAKSLAQATFSQEGILSRGNALNRWPFSLWWNCKSVIHSKVIVICSAFIEVGGGKKWCSGAHILTKVQWVPVQNGCHRQQKRKRKKKADDYSISLSTITNKALVLWGMSPCMWKIHLWLYNLIRIVKFLCFLLYTLTQRLTQRCNALFQSFEITAQIEWTTNHLEKLVILSFVVTKQAKHHIIAKWLILYFCAQKLILGPPCWCPGQSLMFLNWLAVLYIFLKWQNYRQQTGQNAAVCGGKARGQVIYDLAYSTY